MTDLARKRQTADVAAAVLAGRRRRLSVQSAGLDSHLEQWRPGIMVGAGLLGGYFLGSRKATRLATRVLSLASLGLALLRSPLGSLALTAALGKRDRSMGKESTIHQPDAERRSDC